MVIGNELLMNNSLLLTPLPASTIPAAPEPCGLSARAAAIGVLSALLTLPAAPDRTDRVIVFLVAAAASVLAAHFCTLPLRLPALAGRPWLLGLIAGAGLLVAFFVQLSAYHLLHLTTPATPDLLLFTAFVGLALSFLVLQSDHRRSRRQLADSRAQARSLESQIRPHFFFNTLNTVSAIIPDQPAEAQRILGQFANLFRGAMAGSDGQPVPLATELALVRDYLDIERARFGARLRFTLPDSAQYPDLEIPPLTLQPLVENAVRHGVARLLEGGEIRVSLTLLPQSYQVTVANPVEEPPAMTNEALLPPGHSLRLVADRLDLLYGRRAWIRASCEQGLFALTLHLPRSRS
jgi:two-component system sensor histidine kinase AlgZ